MGHKTEELVMQRLNHFIQNRSNRTIKMSVNAVKTTRLRRPSLGIVRSITPFRRNGIGPGVEGSCWGKNMKIIFQRVVLAVALMANAERVVREEGTNRSQVKWAMEGH